jgi:hypothetical protein
MQIMLSLGNGFGPDERLALCRNKTQQEKSSKVSPGYGKIGNDSIHDNQHMTNGINVQQTIF